MVEGSKSLKDLDRVADRIRLHRSQSSSPVLLVEGPDDQKLLAEHIPNVQIFPCGGRSAVLGAVAHLSQWEFDRYACVVDRDFDWDVSLENEIPCLPYLMRDLEAMLIYLGCLIPIVENMATKCKLAKRGGSDAVIEKVMGILQPVSNLRSVNVREGWGLPFGEVKLGGFIDKDDLVFKVRDYCHVLAQKSLGKKVGVDEEVLVRFAESGKCDDFGPRGKDVAVVVGIALRHYVGNCSRGEVSGEKLCRILRLTGRLELSQSHWLEELKKLLES